MEDLHYNYVVFNSVESKLKYNPDGYYTICTKDLENRKGINCVNVPLAHLPLWLRYLYNVHVHQHTNKYFKLPFKSLWYPLIFQDRFDDNKPVCFVILERWPIDYLQYLKKKYPESRFIALYRDLRKITEEIYPDHPDNPIFDFQMTIDEKEASKFGYIHFDEFESKIDVPISNEYPESDVFFAGKAKDRLPRLLRAYDIMTKAGLKVTYYLTGVPQENRVPLDNVTYADRPMSYSEMLYHTVNTRCVLEINQAQAVGYTSRFLEAVMFNKRLVTDNIAVRKSKFYSKDNIQVISEIDDISVDFINGSNEVNYNYNNEFSPLYLLERIDKELVKRYGKQ